MHKTIRPVAAQAIARWRTSKIDAARVRACGFGLGGMPCRGAAPHPLRDHLPLGRRRNRQGMGLAAAADAKNHLRRRFMSCTTSAGPGRAKLLTAAAPALATVTQADRHKGRATRGQARCRIGTPPVPERRAEVGAKRAAPRVWP